jgi:hypothetical protein
MDADDEYEARIEALFQKSEAAWLANRIGDTCEDYGSADRTLAGVPEDKRAKCERQIAREKRDHAASLRDHRQRQAIWRERANAKKAEQRAKQKTIESRQPTTDLQRQAERFTTNVRGAEIMKRFNTRKTTG